MAISTASIQKIKGAILTKNLIRILYAKKKTEKRGPITERVIRVVEPYEITSGGYLYAWDTTKGKRIKTFILNNINNVLVMPTSFKDRYPDGGQGKAFPTTVSVNPPDARRLRPTVNTSSPFV